MNLFVDIGNSRLKWMCSGQERGLSLSWTAETLPDQLMTAWKDLQSPESVYISNVAGEKVADIVSRYSREHWDREPVFMAVSKRFHGLVNAYEDIRQMGVDRWMALAAAWTRYKDNLCIVDFGTHCRSCSCRRASSGRLYSARDTPDAGVVEPSHSWYQGRAG